jgi:hypothetical protein
MVAVAAAMRVRIAATVVLDGVVVGEGVMVGVVVIVAVVVAVGRAMTRMVMGLIAQAPVRPPEIHGESG